MKYDIEKLSRIFFPWFWQNPENLALIDVLMSSLDEVNDNTSTLEALFTAKVGYSIQRLSLESSLNDQFDEPLRRIVIENNPVSGNEFVYNEAEVIIPSQETFIFNDPEVLPGGASPVYYFNNNETAGAALVGFNVLVPTSLMSIEADIRSWIELVLIFGIEYDIIFI